MSIYILGPDGKLEGIRNSWGAYDAVEFPDGSIVEIPPKFNKEEFKNHKIVPVPQDQCFTFDQIVEAIKEGYKRPNSFITMDEIQEVVKDDAEVFRFSEFKGFPPGQDIPWKL